MTHPIRTHINAYYADLITAKQEAAAAQQRVSELEDVIKARGGALPDEGLAPSEVLKEDVASSDDVSAAEKSSKKKGER